MHKQENELKDRADIDAIIGASEVCHVAFAVDNMPYVVPLNFGYDGQALYFHTAKAGRKIDCIEANPQVCFEMISHARIITDPDRACRWGCAYASVIGYGHIRELTAEAEKIRGLDLIMAQYSEGQWTYPGKVVDQARIWRLSIDSVTGKQSKKVT